jgi:flagellar biosynthetic protein FliQ
MNEQLPYALLRDGMMDLAVASAPILLALLVSGLIVGILQAATQVNDSAASFLPRLVAAIATLWLFGGWMMERMARIVARALEQMAGR